ncbi:hypothetical protein K2P97_03480 [bacterium]|nr:hypothetical protein [bacterium]
MMKKSLLFLFISVFVNFGAAEESLLNLNFKSQWTVRPGSSVGIAKIYVRKYNTVEIPLVFSSYNIPLITSSSDLDKYLVSQHPGAQLKILSTKKCTSLFDNCFISKTLLSRDGLQKHINYVYLGTKEKVYLGFFRVSGASDGAIIGDKLMDEVENALPQQ